MDYRLIEGLMVAIAPVLKDSIAAGIEKDVAPLRVIVGELKSHVTALEERAAVPGPVGPAGEPGQDGADADPVEVAALLVPEVERAVAAVPPAKDGEPGPPGPPGPPGRDGADADPVEIASLLIPEVERAVASIPKPENGADGAPGEKGDPGEKGEQGAQGAQGEAGPAGEKGAPGEPGQPGDQGLPGEQGPQGEKGITESVQLDTVVEAVKTFDVDRLLKDALSAGGEAGGIDVMAPAEVAAEMSAAISMLADPASKAQPTVQTALAVSPPRPRSFRFERNEQNVIIAAHEDYGP